MSFAQTFGLFFVHFVRVIHLPNPPDSLDIFLAQQVDRNQDIRQRLDDRSIGRMAVDVDEVGVTVEELVCVEGGV